MKYLILVLLLSFCISSKAQFVYMNSVGTDKVQTITMVVNNSNIKQSYFIYNDLKRAPSIMHIGKDTTVSGLQLASVYIDGIAKPFFLVLPDNGSSLTIYDQSMANPTKYLPDSHQWHLANDKKQSSPVLPDMASSAIFSLFKLLLL